MSFSLGLQSPAVATPFSSNDCEKSLLLVGLGFYISFYNTSLYMWIPQSATDEKNPKDEVNLRPAFLSRKNKVLCFNVLVCFLLMFMNDAYTSAKESLLPKYFIFSSG